MTKKARTVVSYKDVQLAYLIEGVEGVAKLIEGRDNPSAVVNRAIKVLKERGKKTAALEKFARDTFEGSSRGRANPRVGDTRSYKAQQLKAGGAPFLRLPLATLEVEKGAELEVKFEKGRIIVSPK